MIRYCKKLPSDGVGAAKAPRMAAKPYGLLRGYLYACLEGDQCGLFGKASDVMEMVAFFEENPYVVSPQRGALNLADNSRNIHFLPEIPLFARYTGSFQAAFPDRRIF